MKRIAVLLLIFIGLFPMALSASAYSVVIQDDAGLLSDAEETELREKMQALSENGNMIFLTADSNPFYSAQNYAEDYYYSHFGNDNGALFLIDMDTRMIYLVTDGELYDKIPEGKCTLITDNIFEYAREGDYGRCAIECFRQVGTVIGGGRIDNSMQLITNGLLALMASFFIMFIVVKGLMAGKTVRMSEMTEAARTSFQATTPDAVCTGTTKRYSPRAKSGGSGGGGGGGFSGGSGFSGGGGGHSF